MAQRPLRSSGCRRTKPAVAELEKLVDNADLFEEVSEMLESVYRARGLTDRLRKLYEKRVGFADSVVRASTCPGWLIWDEVSH